MKKTTKECQAKSILRVFLRALRAFALAFDPQQSCGGHLAPPTAPNACF